MPHPEFLRRLLDEYETALAEEQRTAVSGRSTRSQDLAYTLCVSTGTRAVSPALEAAHRMLAAAGAPRAAARVPVTPVTRTAPVTGDARVTPQPA